MFSSNQLKFCSKERQNLDFLKECKPIEKNVIRYIINNLESTSDAFYEEQIKTKYQDDTFFKGEIIKNVFSWGSNSENVFFKAAIFEGVILKMFISGSNYGNLLKLSAD